MKKVVCDHCGKEKLGKCFSYGKCLCNSCFLEIIEKRIKRELKFIPGFTIKREFCILNRDETLTKILLFFFERIFEGYGKYRVVKRPCKDKLTLIPTFVEEYAKNYLAYFFDEKFENPLKEKEDFIMYSIVLEEINYIAELKGWQKVEFQVPEIIEEMTKRYKTSIFSLSNAITKFRRLAFDNNES